MTMKSFNKFLLDEEPRPGRPGSAERVRWEISNKKKPLKNQKRRRNKNKPDNDDIFRTSINMPRKSSEPTRWKLGGRG